MSTPRLSRKELERTVRILRELGGHRRNTAAQLGVTVSTLDNRLRRARAIGLQAPQTNGHTFRPKAAIVDTDDDTAARRVRRLEEELATTRTALRRTVQKLDAAEDVRGAILGLGAAIDGDAPIFWKPAAPAIAGTTVLLPILFTSDFQVGEVVRPDEIDGLNAYDKDVFAERYARLIDRTIDLAENHVGKASFPGIFYLRGGDAISGEIHEELRETNDLPAVPAVRWLLAHEREGIRRLKAKFGHVRVISIPGNHGRHTVKPRSKGYLDKNFETLLALWLESVFADDPSVEFVLPASGDAYFDAQGWKFVLSHGDRMGSRGGTGFMGPIATIARGHKKVFENWSMTGRRVDFVLTGHLHTSVKTEIGFGNGAIVGYSQFARDLRMLPDAPKQWLLFTHAEHGVAAQFEVQLAPKPVRTNVNAHYWAGLP